MSPPNECHVVSCKRLRDESLHTFRGMVGYWMKDNKEEHLEFVHHNVSAGDMNEGMTEYAMCGKVGLSMCASHRDILQKAHKWMHFHRKTYRTRMANSALKCRIIILITPRSLCS